MIEIRGTKQSIKKHLDIIHGVSKKDIIVICLFTEDEYKREWEKPIDKLYKKLGKKR